MQNRPVVRPSLFDSPCFFIHNVCFLWTFIICFIKHLRCFIVLGRSFERIARIIDGVREIQTGILS